MIKYFLILGLLFSVQVKAEIAHEQFVHLTAHIAASYMLSTITYGAYQKVFNLSKVDSLVASTLTAFMIGFTYQMLEFNKTNSSLHLHNSLIYNGIGIFIGINSIILFEF